MSFALKVTCRGNDGSNSEHAAVDAATAERIAKTLRTPESYMVCIVVDGRRQKRWDRGKVVGANRWRRVDVGAYQTTGPLRQTYRVPARNIQCASLSGTK